MPQPCHSCNVIEASGASLGAALELENELWRVLGLESIRVFEEKAREGEHLNAMALEGEAMADSCLCLLSKLLLGRGP